MVKRRERSTPKPEAKLDVVFDADTGESAFRALEPTLRAMPAAAVSIPNIDVRTAAAAALALVDIANDPARTTRFARLPEDLFPRSTVGQLETAARAAWYAQARARSEAAARSRAQVDAATYQASGELLRDLLKLIDYHLGNVPEVAVEIADIRVGAGYQDRATDLVRAAALWDRWRTTLERDPCLYHPGDGDRARDFAERILTALRAHTLETEAAWIDLRNRAFTLVASLYGDVLAAGRFLFRKEPEELARFVALRRCVVGPRKRGGAPAPAPEPDNDATRCASADEEKGLAK